MKFLGPLFKAGIGAVLIRGVLDDAAVRGRSWIKRDTPVRTGRLRGDWRVKVSQLERSVKFLNEVPYCKFVEFGTRFMKPRHMLTRNEPKIKSLILRNMALIPEKLK